MGLINRPYSSSLLKSHSCVAPHFGLRLGYVKIKTPAHSVHQALEGLYSVFQVIQPERSDHSGFRYTVVLYWYLVVTAGEVDLQEN